MRVLHVIQVQIMRDAHEKIAFFTFHTFLVEDSQIKVAYYSFPRLSSARYNCLPDVSISRACKNDASNIKR